MHSHSTRRMDITNMQWWILSNSNTFKFEVVSGNKPTPNSTYPNAIIGPFSTKAAAEAALQQSGYSIGGLGAAGAGAAAGTSEVFSGIDAVGNFFNKLGEPQLWIRIAEVVLGLLLIGVALGKLSGIDAKVTKAVNTAVKVA